MLLVLYTTYFFSKFSILKKLLYSQKQNAGKTVKSEAYYTIFF